MKLNDKFDSKIIKAVHEINEKLGGKVVFAGSFGLKYYGLLDRIIKDLDVFTIDYFYGTIEADTILNRESSGRFTVNGKEVLCVNGRTSDDVPVDFFYKNEPLQYQTVNFHGVEIKIEDPKYAIEAKEQYEKNNPHMTFNIQKHKDDLFYIYKLNDAHNEDDLDSWSVNTNDDLPF